MTGNSSKFFRKILKTGLVTASGAAIMLSSSGALGAAINVINNAALLQGTNSGGALSANFLNGANLTLTGGFNLSTDGKVDVGSVNINANAGQTFTFTKQASVGGDLEMNVIVDVGGNVTLTNVTVVAGGPSNVAVNAGALALGNAAGNMTIAGGAVNQTGAIGGNLAVSGAGSLIGAATDVKGTVALAAGATGAVTIHDALNVAVVTTEGGTLTLRKAAGGIKFTGTAIAGTTINVVDDAASNVGNVNNDAANGAGTGILNFLGAGAANNIGANASLAEVNFKGAGAVAITGTSNATTFTVGNAGADVTATGLMTGNAAFTADGQLTLGNGITGAVTTAANNTGKLIVTAGDVGGAIGTNAGDILNSVTFNGVSNVKND